MGGCCSGNLGDPPADFCFYFDQLGFAGRNLISDRAYRWMVGCCAVFLVGFGGYFGWRGILAISSL